MDEILRVTRRACCLGLFNAYHGPEHVEQPVDDYHWNMLSIPLIEAMLPGRGCEVQIVSIDAWLRRRFQCDDAHNKQACTIIATIKPNHPGFVFEML